MTGGVAGPRLAAGRDLVLAVTAALTVWTAVLAWRGFTESSGRYLLPLLVIGLVVALTGSAARTLGVPGVLVVPLQAVVGGIGALGSVTGSWLPGPTTLREAREALDLAVDSASRYAAPVAADVPPVEPLLLVAGLACLLLVDVTACSLRRVSLASLPLLTIYTLPVSMLGGSVAWWVFALPAVGFTAMLYQGTAAELDRWDADDAGPDGVGGDRRSGSAFATALGIGTTATGLALLVPLAVPTMGFSLLGGSGTGNGDEEISLENPMTDMRRDLRRPDDTPLLRAVTAEPDPSYLRISVLNRFSEDAWTSGDRDLPDDQLAQGAQPPPEGVADSVPRSTRAWDIEVFDEFESTWLPTPFPLAAIEAEGRWKYDEATRDFIAAEEDLTTAGLRYSLSALDLELSAEELATSSPSSAAVGTQFTDLPDDLPDEVGDLARDVTQGADSEFDRAVALQDWFRRDGGFTYDLEASDGNGPNTLTRFLDADDPSGRTGYCEQFASAMAAMARELDMPSRVAVGFLRPTLVGDEADPVWEFSSDDLHAWPEIYFPGAGWVRFEPTPATRASRVPAYTRERGPTDVQPEPEPDPGQQEQPEPDSGGSTQQDRATQPLRIESSAPLSAGIDARTVLLSALALVLLVAVLAGPVLARRARTARRRRTSSPVEAAWAELADTMVDLGHRWPSGRSPAEARRHVLPAVAGATADLAHRAADALDRLVASLELARYSRPGVHADDTGVRGDLTTVTEAIREASPRRTRVMARWLPRSLVRRPVAPSPTSDTRTPQGVGTVVDRLD